MVRAYLASDPSYDGVFYTAVKTTGIFCRPVCPARKPLPENVEFFRTAREALFSGYRPCKRCRPMEAAGAAPEWVRPLIEEIERDPSRRWRDSELRQFGVEPSPVRRWFAANYGMTFQAYTRARRLGSAFTQIRQVGDLMGAAFDAGYESQSGFREAFEKLFGCPPGRADSATCVKTAWIETPLGPMVACATEQGICLLEFSDRRMLERQFAIVRRRYGAALVPGEAPAIRELRVQLAEYFAGTRREFTVALDPTGSEFQTKVWTALREIPHGQTVPYAELARRCGNPAAVRAVARANGDNRIAILIPCHRVVGGDGDLTGYGGGLWRKRVLLDLEADTVSQDRLAAVRRGA
jgi:AraC family transcriptional regulator of adaptative response/methylated-DNA-[protein]-cysteine methyltransferase